MKISKTLQLGWTEISLNIITVRNSYIKSVIIQSLSQFPSTMVYCSLHLSIFIILILLQVDVNQVCFKVWESSDLCAPIQQHYELEESWQRVDLWVIRWIAGGHKNIINLLSYSNLIAARSTLWPMWVLELAGCHAVLTCRYYTWCVVPCQNLKTNAYLP